MKRVLIDMLLLGSSLFLPWWVVILGATLCFFIFRHFYEIIFIAFFMDSLYASPVPSLGGFQFVMTAVAVLIFLIGFTAKKRMRLRP